MNLQELERILGEAAEKKDPTERESYLQSACANNQELRAEVDRLLKANELSSDFLYMSVVARPEEHIGEKPGDMVGRYKLVRQLGEGGFGRVFLAEQLQPVRRNVALKVIKAGMDTREVIARFEVERQALALMDHPGIARVLDAGATDAGRPYFVMELVDGVPITTYCDEHHLSLSERLLLFKEVCRAVQHAHQKAIIHRDLKPSNILVIRVDLHPVPKVIDFGVAKALGQKLTEKTLFTGADQMIGTPAYMSPEQAELGRVDIDTRSDIYSLGVILYELLTGVTPFDREAFKTTAIDELRRLIHDIEPPRPSTRLRLLGPKTATAAIHRRLSPEVLLQSLEGDLDWIVMRCLEKDREVRYQTADALESDIQRHLLNHPIAAAPPATLYRARKFVSRHHVTFLIAAGVFALLVAGVAISTWQAFRALGAEKRETALRKKAQLESAKSLEISHLLEEGMKGVVASMQPGEATNVVGPILTKTAESLAQQLTDRPEVEVAVWVALARTFERLGLPKEQEDAAFTALKIGRERLAESSLEVGMALQALADANAARGDFQPAEQFGRKALSSLESALGPENLEVARTLYSLGSVLYHRGNAQEALTMLTRSLRLRQALAETNDLSTTEPMLALANVFIDLGQAAQAAPLAQKAVSIRKMRLGPNHAGFAEALECQAAVQLELKQFREAEANCHRALEIRNSLPGPARSDSARALCLLGKVMIARGELSQAEKTLRGALKLCLDYPDTTLATSEIADSLAIALWRQGKSDEVENLLRMALQPRPGKPFEVTTALPDLIDFLLEQGKAEAAEGVFKTFWLNPNDVRPEDAYLLLQRGGLYARLRSWSEALKDLLQVTRFEPDNARAQSSVAAVLIALGDSNAYTSLCRTLLPRFASSPRSTLEQVVMSSSILPDPKAATNSIKSRMADLGSLPMSLVTYRAGQPARAAELGKEALQKVEPLSSQNDLLRRVQAGSVLAMALSQAGKPAEAVSALEKVEGLLKSGPASRDIIEVGRDWPDWVFAHALFREAHTLIKGLPVRDPFRKSTANNR